MSDAKKSARRWPRRLLWLVLFLGLTAAVFVTVGSLWAQVVTATWARWLLTAGTALVAPFLVAAFIAGRVSEGRALGVLGWGFLGLMVLAGGVPWVAAYQRTRTAVARDGLWIVESVTGPRSPETRRSWSAFFGVPAAAAPGAAPATGGPPPAPNPPAAPGSEQAPGGKPRGADGGATVPARPPVPPASPADGGRLR